MDGKTSWWMPFRSTRLRVGASYMAVGARVESTIHGRWPVRFTTETVEVNPGATIRVNYVAGSFRGAGRASPGARSSRRSLIETTVIQSNGGHMPAR